MASKAPTGLKWGAGEVYNVSQVLARHVKDLCAHVDFLASVRHLQMPSHIGPPLDPTFNRQAVGATSPSFGGMLGDSVWWKLRIPAYATHVRVSALATIDDKDPAFIPTVWYSYTIANAKAGYSLWGKFLATNETDQMDGASWGTTMEMSSQDTIVLNDPWPIPPAWQGTESYMWVVVVAGPGTLIHSLWLQSEIAPGAKY
jgi:hypothetical protein